MLNDRSAALATLHRHDLRRCVVAVLYEHRRSMGLGEIVEVLEERGIRAPGRASKTISDLLRSDASYGRVVRVRRGVYRYGYMPETTLRKTLRRARALFANPTRNAYYRPRAAADRRPVAGPTQAEIQAVKLDERRLDRLRQRAEAGDRRAAQFLAQRTSGR